MRARRACFAFFFFFNDPAPTEIYTLPLHDALPIWAAPESRSAPGGADERLEHPVGADPPGRERAPHREAAARRSEEHTSELQSRLHLVCRLLLEKKKQPRRHMHTHNVQALTHDR